MKNFSENEFRLFAPTIGGELIPESNKGPRADFFFDGRRIIAELKSLSVDSTAEINAKLHPFVMEWFKNRPKELREFAANNTDPLELRKMPEEIQDFWIDLIKRSMEPYIRSANRQIRETKLAYDAQHSIGLLIIFNAANDYQSHPESYRRLLASILRKRKTDGTLRYPHVKGAVYCSFETVKTFHEGMNFWANLQMMHSEDDDPTYLATFQEQLKLSWYSFVEARYGVTVRSHTDPPKIR